MSKKHYTLTLTAQADLQELTAWSIGRWGNDLTDKYLRDLHDGAEYLAENSCVSGLRNDLTANTGLSVYPIREHYIAFTPVAKNHIVIVAFIRQGRDIPNILRKAGVQIERELKEIFEKIQSGKIRFT